MEPERPVLDAKNAEKLINDIITRYGVDAFVLANLKHGMPRHIVICDETYQAIREYLERVERIKRYFGTLPFDVLKDLLSGIWLLDEHVKFCKFLVLEENGYIITDKPTFDERASVIRLVSRDFVRGALIYRMLYPVTEDAVVGMRIEDEFVVLILTSPSWTRVLHFFDTMQMLHMIHLLSRKAELYCNLLPESLRYRCRGVE